jgi:hypothetical protein
MEKFKKLLYAPFDLIVEKPGYVGSKKKSYQMVALFKFLQNSTGQLVGYLLCLF